MIPKIIHFCWFSNEEFPPLIQSCIASWRKHCPDYQLRHWTMADARAIDNIFLQEALDRKKWAFAADFIRFYAIYHEGGIYLDTDVELYKSLDSLLEHSAFIGRETSIQYGGCRTENYLTAHAFGAVAKHPYINLCLSYYNDRHFVLTSAEHLPSTLKYDQTLLPYIMTEVAREFGYNPSALAGQTSQLLEIKDEDDAPKDKTVAIYPTTAFDATTITAETFCKHLALGSWRDHYQTEFTYSIGDKIKWRLLVPLRWIAKKFFNANIIELH